MEARIEFPSMSEKADAGRFAYILQALSGHIWLEPDTGIMIWRRLWIRTARVSLAEVERVAVITNRAGGLMVSVKCKGRVRRRFLPVLALVKMHISMTPERMSVLADAFERWTPTQARGDTVELLRAQAAYVAQGGPLTESPLAPRISSTWLDITGTN